MCGGSGLGAWAALALCALHFRTPPRLKQPAEATKERAHSPSPPFGVIQTNEKQQQQQQQPAPQLCRQWRAVVVRLHSPRREHSVIAVIGEVLFFVDVVKFVFVVELLVTSIVIEVLIVIVIVVV